MRLLEKCYGVVIAIKEEEYKFLILKQINASWSFPKGHHENKEKPIDTALRELKEEAGITEVEILDFPLAYEEYEVDRFGGRSLKNNEYFTGIAKSKEIKIQKEEIEDYKWATYKEAIEMFSYNARREVLNKVKEYLEKYEQE